ncbi:MAG: aminotransferase class V-fold PLP-dependent enzyme [Betaproteobacteria bacterium]|nr:MAG: aminotransferase class V-fold PLP-dependent enzyme [Betaproteobacteria bacterium]
MIEFGAAVKREFLLESGVAFLNHGSFGAAPSAVLEAAERWRQRMEANPDLFLREILPGELREAAAELARFVRARPDDVVFVDNATAGVNAVLRALELRARDEILATTHTYGAVRQAIRYVCDRTGAKLVEAQITLPVADAGILFSAVADRLSERTRLAVLDHVSSPTGLIFPVAELAALARARGAHVLIDGAHGPGQLELDVPALGADWYVGNCHKWLFAPRSCAFLWCREDSKRELHPLAISHHYGEGFTAEFDWTGTRDFSAWLAVVDALRFFDRLGAARVRAYNHDLVVTAASRIAEAWQTPLDAPAAMHGSMIALRLPPRLQAYGPPTRDTAGRLQSALLAEHRVAVAVMALGDALWARISGQIYNTPEDYEKLLSI